MSRAACRAWKGSRHDQRDPAGRPPPSLPRVARPRWRAGRQAAEAAAPCLDDEPHNSPRQPQPVGLPLRGRRRCCCCHWRDLGRLLLPLLPACVAARVSVAPSAISGCLLRGLLPPPTPPPSTRPPSIQRRLHAVASMSPFSPSLLPLRASLSSCLAAATAAAAAAASASASASSQHRPVGAASPQPRSQSSSLLLSATRGPLASSLPLLLQLRLLAAATAARQRRCV